MTPSRRAVSNCVYINQGVSFSSMAWQTHAIEQTQLRSQYHEDGVGRLKLDFHTGIDSGHTAWILMSCALVRRPGVFIRAAAHMSTTQVNFMTPGLAFFYGGLVRRNHVLSIIIQNYVSISASRGAAAPSRHRRDSFPGMMEVGGFFLDFGAVRTASSDRDAPRRSSATPPRASRTRCIMCDLGVPRRLHAIDATRFHQTRSWAVF